MHLLVSNLFRNSTISGLQRLFTGPAESIRVCTKTRMTRLRSGRPLPEDGASVAAVKRLSIASLIELMSRKCFAAT